MGKCLLFIFIAVTVLFISVRSQTPGDKTPGIKNEPQIEVQESLRQIENLFHVRFVYEDALLRGKKTPPLPKTLRNISEALEYLLPRISLSFTKIGEATYVLKPTANDKSIAGGKSQTGNLIGRITNASDEGLVAANVQLENTPLGTFSDHDGVFWMSNIPVGEYSLRISYLGFKTLSRKIAIQPDSTLILHFTLVPDLLKLDAVVATATRRERSQKDSPLSLTLFTRNDLQKLATNSQADILRSVPGVHAEGGGGEVATNVFVRGLPASGQYKYTPMQIDGMPVQGTFGLTSSAQDVYYRQDLGIQTMEFVRGGSSTLFGVGSVAGIISYHSKKGGSISRSDIQIEWATKDRMKIDFNTGGPLSNSLFYDISGFYRFDEGPLKTGLPTRGVQLRGNMTLNMPRGTVTLYGQYIDDRVQFYLPLPIQGGTRKRARGNDGRTVFTMQTAQAADISYPTPDGIFQTSIEDGVVTRGGYFMVEFNQNFASNWFFHSKTRFANYDHKFNLFLTGAGISGVDVETQKNYVIRNFGPGFREYIFSWTESGLQLPAEYRLFENRILDRNRPFFEMAADINLSKILKLSGSEHRITVGTFLTRTEAADFDVLTTYLGEFNDQPRLVNLAVISAEGDTVQYSRNGVTNPGAGYTNNAAKSSKVAAYIGDEIQLNRWSIDMGFRYELNVGDIIKEESRDELINPDPHLSPALQHVKWGSGKYNRRRIRPASWGAALAAGYELNRNLNLYANLSRGYFFPELRSSLSFARDSSGNYIQPDPGVEKVIQSETGLKFGSPRFSATGALYFVYLTDRLETDFINDPDGSGEVIEITKAIGKTRTLGLEWTSALTLSPHVVLNAAITLQGHEVVASPDPKIVGKWLRRQPRFMTNLGISYRGSRLDMTIYGKHIGKRFSNSMNTIELKPNSIVNFDMGYTVPLAKNQTIRLGLHVYNLFNDDGLDEADPRQSDRQIEDDFLIARPILPRRMTLRALLRF